MNAVKTQTLDYVELMQNFPPGSELILRGTNWQNYEQIIDSVGEANSLRISFDGQSVKIMTLSIKHEKRVRFFERLIDRLSSRKRINILSFGSATMKKNAAERGAEPDCMFYVQNVGRVAHQETIDFNRDVPPDIVVEVDIQHASDDKFEIYAALSIPEFWLYDGRKLNIYRLENNRYVSMESSQSLPILTADALTNLLNRLPNEEQFNLLNEFETWLENQK